MKKSEQYQSVLVAIQYKNIYEDVITFLRDKSTLSQNGFNVFVSQLNADGIVQGFKQNSAARVLVNQIRVQYEDANISADVFDKIPTIIEQLKESRKIMIASEETEFLGAILQVNYELDESETTNLKQEFFNKWTNFKRGELRINFLDSELLNYNIFFALENNILTVTFDVNTRNLPGQEDWTVEKILGKIRSYTDSNDEIKKLISNER